MDIGKFNFLQEFISYVNQITLNRVLYILCSVSSLMTTTEAVVVELPKDEKESPAMGGGMTDLGY